MQHRTDKQFDDYGSVGYGSYGSIDDYGGEADPAYKPEPKKQWVPKAKLATESTEERTQQDQPQIAPITATNALENQREPEILDQLRRGQLERQKEIEARAAIENKAYKLFDDAEYDEEDDQLQPEQPSNGLEETKESSQQPASKSQPYKKAHKKDHYDDNKLDDQHWQDYDDEYDGQHLDDKVEDEHQREYRKNYRQEYYDHEEQYADEKDDRELYEEFELITKKFMLPINEETKYIVERELGYRNSRMVFYRADWYTELDQWGKNFVKDQHWKTLTFGMKGKYCCFFCRNKQIQKLKQKYGKNYMAESHSLDGWTTSNCTVQFLYQEIRGHKRSRDDLEFKLLVRAYSQFCKQCSKVGDVGTYIDEIERLSVKFSEKLVQRYFRNYRPSRPYKPQRISNMVTPHIKELCSACKHGCCVYREKPQRKPYDKDDQDPGEQVTKQYDPYTGEETTVKKYQPQQEYKHNNYKDKNYDRDSNYRDKNYDRGSRSQYYDQDNREHYKENSSRAFNRNNDERRPHANYKTQPCKNFEKNGECKFGENCSFQHNEKNDSYGNYNNRGGKYNYNRNQYQDQGGYQKYQQKNQHPQESSYENEEGKQQSSSGYTPNSNYKYGPRYA